jgi:hypothetical protein
METKKWFSGLFLSIVLMYGGLASAQSIGIDGELRTRTELRSGAKSQLYDSLGTALVTNERARLTMTYASNDLKAKVTLQDTHTFGQTAYNVLSTSTFGVYEAWGEYLFAPKMSFALGRQAITYDDGRLFSVSDWSNTGNAHDLLLLKYSSSDFTLHIAGAWNNASDVYQESAYSVSYQTMSYIWASKPIGNFKLSGIWVNEGYQKTTSTNLQGNINNDRRWYRNTIGGNLGYGAESFPVTFYGTGYYQFGHDTSGKKLNAYLLALKAIGKVINPLSLNCGVDYFSGSKYDLASNEDHTFNKLFGTNHSFNGFMEYWTTLPTGGLTDLYGGATWLFGSKLKADATYHAFGLAQEVKGFDTKGLGSEIDFTLTCTLSPQVSLQGGWSSYFATSLEESVKKLKSGVEKKFPQWAFVSISFKPKFL